MKSGENEIEAAYIQQMRNSQQLAEYKVECMNFVEEIKKLDKSDIDSRHFGSVVSTLLRDYKL